MDSKNVQVRLEPPPARRWATSLLLPLIIRRVVEDFAAAFGVRHCRVWSYDLFIFIRRGGGSSAFLAEERSDFGSVVCAVLQRFWGLTRIDGAKNGCRIPAHALCEGAGG